MTQTNEQDRGKVTLSLSMPSKRIQLFNKLGHELTSSDNTKTNVLTAMVYLLNEGINSLIERGEVSESEWV